MPPENPSFVRAESAEHLENLAVACVLRVDNKLRDRDTRLIGYLDSHGLTPCRLASMKMQAAADWICSGAMLGIPSSRYALTASFKAAR